MQREFPIEALVIQHEFGSIGVDAEDVLAVDDIVSAYTGKQMCAVRQLFHYLPLKHSKIE